MRNLYPKRSRVTDRQGARETDSETDRERVFDSLVKSEKTSRRAELKGAGRDIKAVTIYSRDALTGNPISDESSK